MVLFETLNFQQDENLVEDYSRDAEIDQLVSRYLEMLDSMKRNKTEAIEIAQEIISNSLMNENLLPVADLQDSPLHTLQYAVFKNYAKLISNEESIVYYKKASAIDPLDISLKIHISTILESNGNITEAYTSILDCLQYSLMKHEENDLYARLSKLLYQYGCFNEALEYASRVLQSNPNNSEYLKLKNGILFELEGTINEPRLERTPCKSTMWNTQSEPCVIQIPEKSTLSQLSLILLKSFMKIYQIPEPSNADLSMWIKIEVSDGMDIDTEPSNSSEDSAALIPEVDSSIVEAICDDPIDLEHGNNNDSVNQVIVEGTIVQDDETDGKKRKLDARDKRSSIRVKQQQQIDNEQVVKERELECLTELNEILPQGKEFVEDGSVFLHPSVDTAKLLKQITHDIVLKSGSFVNRAKPKKNVNYTVNYDNWKKPVDYHQFFNSEDCCKRFLQSLKGQVHMIADILIRLVVFTIDSAGQMNWSFELNSILSTILQLIEKVSGFFGILLESNSNYFSDENHQMEVLLFISEMLLDSLVDRVGKELILDHDEEFYEKDSNSNPLCRVSRKTLLDRTMIAIKNILTDRVPSFNNMIRYKWLLAKTEETFGTPKSTVTSLLDCLDLFTGSEDTDTIRLVSCNRDNIIDLSRISSKIRYQQLRLRIDETEYLANENLFDQVVERLSPLFLTLENTDEEIPGKAIIVDMPHQKKLNLLNLLQKSSRFLNLDKIEFKALVQSIIVECDLIEKGISDLFDNLENFSLLLSNLIEKIESKGDEWAFYFLEAILESEHFCFVAYTAVCISWVICKRFKDVPTTPKTTFSKKKTLFESFCARSWKLFYYAIYILFNQPEARDNNLSEILIWAHNQLGFSSLCGGDDGSFLKLVVKHIAQADPYYHYEIYQSYSCLYGTDIKVNSSQQLDDHNCNRSTFGSEAAELLYKFVQPMLIEKVEARNFRSIPKDVKDSLDMIFEVFPEPPKNEVHVQSNQSAIQNLLVSDIDPTVLNPHKSQKLALWEIPASSSIVSPVSFGIYYYQGKIMLNNYYTKQDRPLEYLGAAIRNFKYHLSLQPGDIDAWVSLGNAFAASAHDALSLNITDYRDRIQIASYQRGAFHCFVRAAKLLVKSPIVNPEDQAVLSSLLWGDFALLIQCIISPPMSGAALKTELSQSIKFWTPKAIESLEISSPVVEKDLDALSKKYLYGLMGFVIKKAIKWDDKQWLYYMRLAHAYRKLGKSAQQVMDLYLKSISIMPRDQGSKDQDTALDPIYKAIVYLLKEKFQNRLENSTVVDYLGQLLDLHEPLQNELEKSNDKVVFEDPVIAQIHWILECIKRVDKRKWYHKPYYRIAWMYSKLLHNDELAKEEMVSLLNARSKAGMKRIWRTDFELPGRHFIYFHNYVKCLIQFATSTKDVSLLWLLCKKLGGEDNIILRFQLWIDCRKELLAALEMFAPVKEEFKLLCAQVDQLETENEKKMTQGYSSDISSELYCLVIACDLKRNRKTLEPNLDKFILNLYSKLYLQTGKFTPLAKPVKEAKISAKVLQRALAISRTIGKDKIDPDGAGN